MRTIVSVLALLSLSPIACAEPIGPSAPLRLEGGSFHIVTPSGPLSLSGYGTATIDGVMSPGEWDQGASIAFPVNVPANEEGGTTGAVLFVMNDLENLYLAIVLNRSDFNEATNPFFHFDNDHDGLIEDGDDIIGMSIGLARPLVFVDDYISTSCPGWPPGTYICGRYDTDPTPPGTTDGSTAATNDGAQTTIELLHPLDSSDDLHDFSVAPGQAVGFTVSMRLINGPCVPDWQACIADTYFPASASQPSAFGDIVIAPAASAKVSLCHRTNGKRPYVPISVARAAVAAHRAHGDAAVGASVPGEPSMVFDQSCSPVSRLTLPAPTH